MEGEAFRLNMNLTLRLWGIAPDLSMEGEAFRLNNNYITKELQRA